VITCRTTLLEDVRREPRAVARAGWRRCEETDIASVTHRAPESSGRLPARGGDGAGDSGRRRPRRRAGRSRTSRGNSSRSSTVVRIIEGLRRLLADRDLAERIDEIELRIASVEGSRR
jgi:hypothetical protein